MIFRDQISNNRLDGVNLFEAPARDASAVTRRSSKVSLDDLKTYLENEDVETFNEARKTFKGKIDLQGIQSLQGKNLTGVNLSGAILNNANLTNTVLDGARCAEIQLAGALLDGISAREADFTKANMTRCSILKGKLPANFSNAILVEAILTRSGLSGTNFSGANMEGCKLLQAAGAAINFDGANLINATAKDSYFNEECSVNGAYIRGLSHSGFIKKDKNPLAGALVNQDPPPEKFKTTSPEHYESKLIRGIVGTDLEKYEAAMEQLNGLIGLDEPKAMVKSILNKVLMQPIKEKLGLPASPYKGHYIFVGAPGTAKTTVARIMSSLLHSLGCLEKGHLVETDRTGLVQEHKGGTAIKTTDKVNEAMGGVLLIDEAYSLYQGEGDNFGTEAITTLMKIMEDRSGEFVAILTGYPKEMEEFMNSNSGVRSRFTGLIDFPGYNTGELVDIFQSMLAKSKNTYDQKFIAQASILFGIGKENADASFGNGRFVRNVYDAATTSQSDRLAVHISDLSHIYTTEECALMLSEDLPFQDSGVEINTLDLDKFSWTDANGKKLSWKELTPGMTPFPDIDPDAIRELLGK